MARDPRQQEIKLTTSPRIALTRNVSPTIDRCELTHIERAPIDFDRACAQHAEYEEALTAAGCELRRLPPAPDMADAVFVEDTAVVFDQLAVIALPGVESRRGELASMMYELAKWRRVEQIEPPGTLEGGDVVCIGDQVFVGESKRTNAAGILQLQDLVAPHGLRVVPMPIHHCLHLKSAVTRVGADQLLINPDWTDPTLFSDFELIEIDRSEPHAANAVLAGERVIHSKAFPRTRARLEAAGINVFGVAADELAKAEAGVSCCSVVFEAG